MTTTRRLQRAEAERLRVLNSLQVLDTLPDQFSDSVAIAAATIANAPFSAVSLVDVDRQWFKASVGLPVTGSTRAISFCSHAIRQAGPFVVTDTLLDDRFATNPFVTGNPHFRFYAGFPLVVDGQPLGTLCVIDDRVRELTPEQLERLTGLARGTAAWLAQYARSAPP